MTYRYRLAAVFLMGFFVDCINIFMPAIALPTIAAEFHVGVSAGAWVANAYMLGLTLAIPVSTWLAGRRRAQAHGRIHAGVRAGGLGLRPGRHVRPADRLALRPGHGRRPDDSGGQAAAFNLFQGPERARISTLVMAVALIAPALSPWLGGLIVDHGSRRLIFHSNIPLALAAARWPGAGCATPRPSVRRVRTSRGWR